MKFEFSESEYETSITLTPETADDMAQLIRMVKNSKADKPHLYLSFTKNPWATISIKKLSDKSNKVSGAISNTHP